MKTFIQMFVAARSVSTPAVAIKTADNASAVREIRKSLKDEKATPLIAWDCVTGMNGLNDAGTKALAAMLHEAGDIERPATAALALTLAVLRYAPVDKDGHSDIIVFVHNFQMQTRDNAPEIVQGLANLRDRYKASGALVALLMTAGDILPTELQQDVLVLEQALPTRDELANIVTETAKFAGATLKPEVVKQACDALIGLPAFPSEQSTAMEIDPETKTLSIESLWGRKRSIVSMMPGLSFHQGGETMKDMAGINSFSRFGRKLMGGAYRPNLIIRMDEIEKQLAGSQTDSSGTKGDLLGEFLTWVNDRGIICSLSLGVPGSSKSWSAYCIGGEYKTPVINYSLSAMQDKHVGVSGANQRNAQRTLEAISDGNIWLIATANSLNGLPPELISRFQVGGIWFFDAPDYEERAAILDLKIAKYKLGNQEAPDMAGWTGRDIETCARKAQLLDMSLVEASQFVVPLMKSHAEQMRDLRQSAHNRFLSASNDGVYQFETHDELKAEPVAANGRRMR